MFRIKTKEQEFYFHADFNEQLILKWVKANIKKFESGWSLLAHISGLHEISLLLSDNSVSEVLEIEVLDLIYTNEIPKDEPKIDDQAEADLAYAEMINQ